MKNSSMFLIAIAAVGLCAAVWFLADSRDDLAYRLYEKGDYRRAAPELTKRAESNDSKAQYYLGWIAIKEGDEQGGLAWWRKASDNGYGPASYYLGVSYLQDDYGLGQDILLAREWLQKAIAQGGTSASEVLYDMERSLGPYYLHVLHEQGEAAAHALAQHAPKWLEQSILAGGRAGILNLRYAYNCEGYPINNAPALIAALQPMEARSGRSACSTLPKKITPMHSSIWKKRLRKRLQAYSWKSRPTAWGVFMKKAWAYPAMKPGRGGEVDKEDTAALLARLEKAATHPVYPQKTAWPTAERLDALRAAIVAP